MDSISTNRKAELRSRLIENRSALHPHARRRADGQICTHLLRLLDERDDVDIAAFLAFRGEPDLSPAMQVLHEAGRRIWLPIVEDEEMVFGRWKPGTEMRRNRFGIPEPVDARRIPPERLELVLTPLVAVSATGTRLGMGAGYYDRTFSFLLDQRDAGPWLVGVAYSLQQVDSLPAERWDVPLGGVITERGLQVFRD
ncbi:MAG: 5-formyltetrahydrofolate cyclo-ligase [Wenzhouxiangellaceae bacterium]|nr:5-formyltetrahydrofolate cyclo-ligase [Wenzhouxiangellaceae bacterium]